MDLPKIDLHIHSMASGHAFNTIDEIVAHANVLGFAAIGISDHGPRMEGAPHSGYFEMLDRLPRRAGKLMALYGCEANILDLEGSLDIAGSLLSTLDYVMAGLHRRTPYMGQTIEAHTTAIIAAMRSGNVDIISHPISLNHVVDARGVVMAAKETGVMLEVNKSVMEGLLRYDDRDKINLIREMRSLASANDVPVIFGSDAHHVSELLSDEREWEKLCVEFQLDMGAIANDNAQRLIETLSARKDARQAKNQ